MTREGKNPEKNRIWPKRKDGRERMGSSGQVTRYRVKEIEHRERRWPHIRRRSVQIPGANTGLNWRKKGLNLNKRRKICTTSSENRGGRNWDNKGGENIAGRGTKKKYGGYAEWLKRARKAGGMK